MIMTLRKVCDTFAVSRRAIQGYEKEGLISRSGKNEYGHLLYDEYSQERIGQIKLFQQMGFSLKEIKNIIDAPDGILKAALEKQALKLEAEKSDMERLVSKIYGMIKNL